MGSYRIVFFFSGSERDVVRNNFYLWDDMKDIILLRLPSVERVLSWLKSRYGRYGRLPAGKISDPTGEFSGKPCLISGFANGICQWDLPMGFANGICQWGNYS